MRQSKAAAELLSVLHREEDDISDFNSNTSVTSRTCARVWNAGRALSHPGRGVVSSGTVWGKGAHDQSSAVGVMNPKQQ